MVVEFDLKQHSANVLDRVKLVVGVETFSKAYAGVLRQLSSRRLKRKQTLAEEV